MKYFMFVFAMFAGLTLNAQKKIITPVVPSAEPLLYLMGEREMENWTDARQTEYFEAILAPIKELKTDSLVRQNPIGQLKDLERAYDDTDEWRAVMEFVEKACANSDNKVTCTTLAKARMSLISPKGRQSAEDRAADQKEREAKKKGVAR